MAMDGLEPSGAPPEKYLSTVLQTTMDGFIMADAQGRIIDANDAYCRMSGYTRGELLQLRVHDLDTGPDETNQRIARLNRYGYELFETRHRRKDGSLLEIEASVNYLEADGGRFICFCRDIGQRRKIEQALQESEEKYRRIIENTADVVWTMDLSLRTTYVSPSVERLLGVTPEQYLQRPLGGWLTPESLQMAQAVLKEELLNEEDASIRKDRTRQIEIEYVKPDGTRGVWTSMNVSFLRDRQGRAVGIQGIARDISDRRRAEARMRAATDRLQAVLDNSPLLICELDRQGRYLMANPALAQAMRRTPSELIGRAFADLLPPELSDLFIERLATVVAGKAPVTVEDHWGQGDGQRCFMTTLYPLLDDAGQVQSVGAIAHDITERKRYELALKESENNLKEAQAITRLGRWELDIPTSRLSWSDTIFDLFEIERGDFTASYEAFISYVHPEDRALVDRTFREAVARKAPYEIEHRLLMKDGQIKWVHEMGRTEYDAQGRPLRTVGTVQEITERKIMLELLSRLNQSSGLNALMTQVSHLMREWSGCDAVGIRLQEGDDFPYYQTQGFPAGFVKLENRLCRLSAQGHVMRDENGRALLECMCGRVILGQFDPALPFFSENGSFWTNSISRWLASVGGSDQRGHGPRDRCRLEGYESVALIPLRFGDRNLGLLQFNDRRPGRFTESRIALLERVAANLAMGIAHHRTAEALTRSHDLLSNLARLVPGMIYQFRLYPDGRSALPYASPGIEQMYELSPDQVREDASPAIARMHPHDRDWVVAAIHSSARSLQTFSCEFRVVLPRQGLRWRASEAHPERLPDGSVLWHGIITDITGRKQADEALAHSHNLMRYIIEHNRSAVAVHDRQMRYIYVSKRYLEEYRIKEQDVIGRHHYDVFPDLPQKWRDVHQRALAGEIISAEDDPYERADGTTEWTRWECRPWYEADQSIGGIIVYTEVTTERKRLEMQLVQAQKMESVGRLAGGVAHDYNNMLSVIMGYTEMALEKVRPDDPLHGELLEIFKAARRSADITRQLLAFARKQTIDPKVIDLNEIVESTLRMLRRLIGEEIDLCWLPAWQVYPLKMDPSQVNQILANLCVNARDAIGGVGRITIETECCRFDAAYCRTHRDHTPGDFVRLGVTDTGCGMDRAIQNYIFEPFFTTKDVTQGTGLGLATVYGIVQQNNGFITIQSEPGQGTTFNIYLPRCEAAEAPGRSDVPVEPAAARGETVLLVEDEPAILRMGETMLRHLGYRVLAAGTPAGALRVVREQEGGIDLLITDVVMPEMNGRQLSERLQALYPGLRTLYMSGYTADVIAHRGVLEEGMHFIQKPFSARELGARAREALDRGPA